MNAQQLKNSILQMAVQGKLVPQDPNDEPASILLERIRAEKEKQIKEGTIKREKAPSFIFRGEDNLPYEKVGKNEPVCIADEVPFEIPDSWEWVRLGNCGVLKGGYAFKSAEYVNSGVQVVRISDLGEDAILEKDIVYYPYDESLDDYIIPANSILICLTGSIGKMAWVHDNQMRYLNQRVGMFISQYSLETSYIWFFLHTPYVIEQWVSSKTSTNGNIRNSDVTDLLVPLPPLAEQKRIVTRIASLLPYIERYKVARDSLELLNTSFPTKLKQSILQQAVMGKLVPQDPNDEPASVLLEKIRVEKDALIKAGKLKKDKHESFIYRRDNSHYEKLNGKERCINDEIPFDIPDSWQWVRLHHIACFLNGDRGKNYPKRSEYVNSGVAWINTGHITSDGYLDKNTMNYITPEKYETISNGHIQSGDLVYCLRGATFGKVARVEPFSYGAIASSLMIIRLIRLQMREYIYWYLKSPLAKNELRKYDNGSAQPNLAAKDVENYLVPIPPISEQKRIIDMIERLYR